MSNMFEEIFDYSPVAMLLVDQESKIQFVNKHTELLFKYTKDELIGENISMLIPQNLNNKHSTLVNDYFSSPLPRKMSVGRVIFGVRKDQTKIPVEVTLNPIQAEGRSLVMSSVVDITERSKAEEHFKLAVDGAPNGILMMNAQRTIMFCNRKTEEIFGYDVDELLGERIETLVPNNFKTPHPKFVKGYFDSPKPRAMGIGRELFGKHKSGKLIPVEIGLQPICFDDERFVISSIIDVSQRRENEKKIDSQSEEIKEFAYRTSHDLKSPLLTMGGLVDYIVEDIENGDVESSLEGADKVKTLLRKLNRLIDDILALSKADLKHEVLRAFDFDTYLKDAQEKFNFLFEQNKTDVQSAFLHKRDLFVQNIRLTQILSRQFRNVLFWQFRNVLFWQFRNVRFGGRVIHKSIAHSRPLTA